MKNYEVVIIMAVGLSEDVHYHKFTMQAKDEVFLFRKITRGHWFSYVVENKTTTFHNWIQICNISDISIREIKEEK